MKKAALLLGILFVACLVTQAQEDIFRKHGVTKEPLTLSKGKYKETFYNEDVMQIGTVLIDTRTNKVVKFLEEDTTKFAYKAETTSRFLTVDPLAEEYYSWSPYVYVMNNPLRNIDPFGMDVWSTNDPEQIAKLLAHLKSVGNKETSDPFDYGGWNRMTDDEYKEYNKANSVSFNDDSFNFNINLDDYQGNFKVGMRSKETNYAYITSSDLDAIFAPDGEEAGLNIGGNLVGLGTGMAVEGMVGPYLHKNSKLAKMIFPRSTVVGHAGKYTSVTSAGMRRIWSKAGGAASKIVGGVATPVGIGLMYYEAWTIGRELGQLYGGDAWVRNYRKNQYMNRYKPLVTSPK